MIIFLIFFRPYDFSPGRSELKVARLKHENYTNLRHTAEVFLVLISGCCGTSFSLTSNFDPGSSPGQTSNSLIVFFSPNFIQRFPPGIFPRVIPYSIFYAAIKC